MLVDTVCPGKKQVFENISLSARSVTKRIKNMLPNRKEKLKSLIESFEYVFLGLDESTYIHYTPLLATFVTGVNKKFEIIEKLVKLVLLEGATTVGYF